MAERSKFHYWVLALVFLISCILYLMTKMLGIDWGEKRIGLAIADDSLAQSYGLVGEFAELEKVIEKEGV